jgi:hypothetical protein
VIEPNATAKQIDATWKDMNMLRDSIKSKKDEDAHDRIKIALKMIPKTHVNFDYINPLIVVHDQGVLEPWTTFEAMVKKLVPILRERDAENGMSALNSMALAIIEKRGDTRTQRNDKGTGATLTENKCKLCDLRFCKSLGEWLKCVLHPSVKEAELKENGSTLTFNRQKLVQWMRVYMEKNNLDSMKGVEIPDGWFKTKKAGRRSRLRRTRKMRRRRRTAAAAQAVAR